MSQPDCSASGTYLVWGSITIENGTLLQFEETTKFDQSGTDAIGATFTIKVQGFIRNGPGFFGGADQSIFFGVSATQPTAVGQINAIKSNAWLPRQTFLLKINGRTVLFVKPTLSPGGNDTATLDIDNGPRCLNFSVDRVFGGNSMQATITIQCTVLLCDGPLSYLNNRWTASESFDSDWRMTKTISGVVRIGHVDAWDKAIKRMVLPPLPDGFRVESMNFARSTTGLELTYQIVMQQMFAAPPYPASDWKCTVREEIRQGGGVSDFFFDCRLSGYAGSTKRDLFIVAISTFLTRISTQTYSEGAPDFFMIHAGVVDHLDSNRLDVSIVAQRQWGSADLKTSSTYIGRWLGLVWGKLGLLPPLDLTNADPEYDARQDDGSNVWRDKWFYPDPASDGFPDTIPSLFAMRYDQNPCRGAYWPAGNVISPESPPPQEPPLTNTFTYTGQTRYEQKDDRQASKVADVQSQAFFTEVELQSRYITNRGRVLMPFSYRSDDTQPTGVIRRVHQPVAKRVIYYKATRYGTAPTVPKILDHYRDEAGINYYLQEDEILPHPKKLTPDGLAYLHTIEMRLSYLMDRPLKSNEQYQPGSLPWDTGTLAESLLNLEELGDEEIA